MEKKKDLGAVSTEAEKKEAQDKLPFYKNWRFYVYTLIALCLSFLAISSLLNGCAIREAQKQEEAKTSIRLDDQREPNSLLIGDTVYGNYVGSHSLTFGSVTNSATPQYLISGGYVYTGSSQNLASSSTNYFASGTVKLDGVSVDLYSLGYTYSSGLFAFEVWRSSSTSYNVYPLFVYGDSNGRTYGLPIDTNVISEINYVSYGQVWQRNSGQNYPFYFYWRGFSSGTALSGLTFTLSISDNASGNDAYSSGYNDGYSSGVSDGFDLGFNEGSNTGYEEGYSTGYSEGYDTGMSDGYSDGYSTGYSEGFSTAYEPGWSAGFSSAMQFVDTTFIKGSEIRGLRLVQMEGTSQDDYEALFSALYYGGSSDLVDVYFTNGDWIKRIKTVDDAQNLVSIEAQYIHNGLNGGPITLAYASRQGTAGNYTYYGYVADVFGGSDWGTFAYLLNAVTSPFDDGGYDVLIRSDDVELSYVFPVYYTSWQAGYEAGSSDGYIDGFASGSSVGFQNGRNAADPSALTETLVVVFQQPFNQIYRFLNFNVLGLNLLALSCGIITLFIVVKVVKKII